MNLCRPSAIIITITIVQEDIRQAFTDYLRHSGRRLTQERFIILEHTDLCTQPFCAEDIAASVSAHNIPIALATIYSTLHLLCQAEILTRRHYGNSWRYLRKHRSSLTIECTMCGATAPLSHKGLADFMDKRRVRGFAATSISLTISGLCTRCARLNKQNKSKKTK